jgi:nicotinate-nucleotide adenylyltransferase
VPGVQPAGSSNTHKAPTLPFETRLELCREAFAAISPLITISSVESELPTPNFTVRTLSHMRDQSPDQRLGLMIGQDQLKDFHHWCKPRDILELASLIVVKRDSPDSGFGGILRQSLSQLSDNLGEPFQWTITGAQASFPGLSTAIFLIDQPISIANSTMIRNFISNGQPLPDGWMPASLYNYILNQHFYDTGKRDHP